MITNLVAQKISHNCEY